MMITVETIIEAPIHKVWDAWTNPEHIVQWNYASDDWHCPKAAVDLTPGGLFSYEMKAKDGSMGFDFTGLYDDVIEHKMITYRMSDGRAVEIRFELLDGKVKLSESFEAEGSDSDEMQRAGWQCILVNFKNYVEALM